MKKKIKIMEPPPSFAPKRIQEQWVGLEIPLVENPTLETVGHFKVKNPEDYHHVKGDDALLALISHSRLNALSFWIPYNTGGNFSFHKDFCKLVS